MKKLLLACAVTAAALINTPLATAQQFDSTLVKSFTPSNVSSVLTKMGATNIKTSKGQDGADVIRFNVGEITYTSIIMTCLDGQGCIGLLLGIGLRTDQGSFSYEVVNGFNDKYFYQKAARNADGKVVLLTRYVLSHGGVTEQNIATSIEAFTLAPEIFLKHTSEQVVAAAEKAIGAPLQAGASSVAAKIQEATPAEILAIHGADAITVKRK